MLKNSFGKIGPNLAINFPSDSQNRPNASNPICLIYFFSDFPPLPLQKKKSATLATLPRDPPPGRGESAEPAGVVLDPLVDALDVLRQVGLARRLEVAHLAPVLATLPQVHLAGQGTKKILLACSQPRLHHQ